MEVLERSPQLEALRGYLADVRAGDGRLVLISGEAGAGKSTLIEALEQDAATDGVTWYAGACDGLFTPRALGPMHDIGAQAGGQLADLVAQGAQRDDLFPAVLGHLQGTGPLVVVIEDIHWADEATLDLLGYLGRRLRGVPTLMLLSYRDDESQTNDVLRIALGELARLRATRRVSVPPLTEAAVGQLSRAAGLEGREVYRLTGGNPFFVSEVLQAGGHRVTPSVRDAVLARLGRLSDPAKDCAWAAALAGARVDPELLRPCVPDLPSSLDELQACGILDRDGRDLRFRHELTRLSVEQDAPGHRARQLHETLLQVLTARVDPDPARLAHHAEGAGDAEAVLSWAPRAGRQAARLGAHREAVAQFRRAARFAEGAEPAVVAEIHESLAVELSYGDAWEDAAASAQTALALWRQVGDPEREGATLGLLSRVMWRLCRPEEQEYAEAALTAVQPLGDGPALARAFSSVALACTHAMRVDEALVAADRAETLARSHGLDDVAAESMLVRATVTHSTDLLEDALRFAKGAGVFEQAGCAFGYLADRLQMQRRFDEADRWYQEGVAYCEEHDIATWGYCLESHHGWALLAQGRFHEAADISRRVLGRPVISPENRIASLLVLGIVLARRGAHDEAEPLLDEAASSALRSGLGTWIAEVLPLRAEARWLAGDDEGARADMALVAPAIATRGPWDRAHIQIWLRRLGLPAAADPVGASGYPDPCERWLAGDWQEAARRLDALSCPYDAAMALYDSGDERGLRSALEGFEALGAEAAGDRTRRRLREIGARAIPTGGRRRTREHPAGLTPREAEVLDLLVTGSTNAQIAERLFLSVRTVDHHVSAVLGKLGISTRSEAADRARVLGLLD
jgi:DNA-binding CsgD family transcriptional regulator/tetratricopeptide (TPR) repeat protein